MAEKEEATRPLELSSDHLLVIEGVLTPTRRVLPDWKPDGGSGGGQMIAMANIEMLPDERLCLKVGAAWNEANRTGNNVDVTLTESELWILRERVDSQARVGNAPVGVEIKAMVYEALLSIADARAVNGVMEAAGVREGDVEEPEQGPFGPLDSEGGDNDADSAGKDTSTDKEPEYGAGEKA